MRTPAAVRFYQVVTDYASNDPPKIAYAQRGIDHLMIVDGQPCPNWSRPVFNIEGAPPVDYQENDMGWRLCSERMKRVIDSMKWSGDQLSWLEAEVLVGGAEEYPYSVLHFAQPLPLDVLDSKGTVFNPTKPRVVIKPRLRVEAVGNHKVFTYTGGFEPWFVAGDIKEALETSGCKGAGFVRVG